MTIRIPEPNIFDKILSFIGKKRGFTIPDNLYEEFGPYAYIQAKRESFWKALMRRGNTPPPNGTYDWEQPLTSKKFVSPRREVLFSHHLLTFIESEFSGAQFGDDFQGKYRTEVYFIYNDAFYLLESKSEAETEGSKHPGWEGTFQDVRDAIFKLSFDNQYNKWLLYLAQLNDYASLIKQSKIAKDFSDSYVILGLPISKLYNCRQAIDMTIKNLSISELKYTYRQDDFLKVSYILMKEADLSTFIQSIFKSN